MVAKIMEERGVNIEDVGWGSKLIDAMDEFRKVNQDITANQMTVFILIGLNPGISQRELSKRSSLADGSVARICAVLSDRGNRGRDGLSLIEIRRSEEDYRVTGQYVTGKGRRVFDSLRKTMKAR